MAKVTVKQFRGRQFGGAAGCYGNNTVHHFRMETGANGGVLNADSSAALAIADVVDLGPLPSGMRLDDSVIVISTALTASTTASLGFVYADGEDDADVPQDAAYFGAGIVTSAAARLRNSSAKAIVTLPKDARLILTLAGAANAKASLMQINITGELKGPQN